MNFQRQNLTGAIRIRSFIKLVPVNMGSDWRMFRRAIRLLFFAALCILFSLLYSTGCTFAPKFAPLATVEIRDSANGNTVPLVGP